MVSLYCPQLVTACKNIVILPIFLFVITEMMTMNDIIHQINEIHSKASVMDKVERLAYLNKELRNLDNLACQVGRYIQGRVMLTAGERAAAKHLLDMINYVDAKRTDAQREYNEEVLKELTKQVLIRQ